MQAICSMFRSSGSYREIRVYLRMKGLLISTDDKSNVVMTDNATENLTSNYTSTILIKKLLY